MIVSDFKYISDLHLLRKKDVTGPWLFYVEQDYIVQFRLDGTPIIYTVPAGTPTDFASVPRIVPSLFAQAIDAIEPAIVHDHMCQVRPFTSQVAAAVFLAAMEVSGVPWLRRRVMYRAVWTFGPQW